MCEKNNPDYSYVRPTDEENLSESTNEKLAAIAILSVLDKDPVLI